MQKTFQQDVINRKVIKNTGQLPMYLIENHHEGIVSREKYNAVQAEMARRKAAKSLLKEPPPAFPPTPAATPSRTVWCAASAERCTAAAHGRAPMESASCGAV